MRALITGASRPNGLGAAIATRLADAGCDVMVSYHTKADDALALADAIAARGRRAQAIRADLREDGECRRLISDCITSLGGLEILVNNAASQSYAGPIIDLPQAAWELDLALNVDAVFSLSQEAARHMRTNAGGGSIVLISSVAATVVSGGSAQYSATKAAAEAISRAMAYELAADNVRLNVVVPGPAGPTDFNAAFVEDPANRHALEQAIPSRRLASALDVAEAVAYLVSPAARYLTGARITVDGGFSLGKEIQQQPKP
jgi:NAD(P)-dependent dehydrogenase (short-subunit alcohol dehydrogenase family)